MLKALLFLKFTPYFGHPEVIYFLILNFNAYLLFCGMAEAGKVNKAASKAANAESSRANVSRQAVIKKLSKTFLPESKFTSKLGELSDTNLGSYNLGALRGRMYGLGGHPPSVTAHQIMKSGLYATAGFPPAIRCPEVIMECANCYRPERRTIVSPDGKLFANLTPEAIREAFGIPTSDKMVYRTKERAERMYASSFERCVEMINSI